MFYEKLVKILILQEIGLHLSYLLEILINLL